MLPIKLFRLVYCLFWFNRNIETLCFCIERNNRNKHFVSESAETSFGSSFGCFELKLVSKDTLVQTQGLLSYRQKVNYFSYTFPATSYLNLTKLTLIYQRQKEISISKTQTMNIV